MLRRERAERLGHRPGQYRVESAGGPFVQRLLHETNQEKLYTSDGWADLEESIEVPKQNGGGTETKTKKVSDYLADDSFKTAILNNWEVNLWNRSPVKWKDSKKGFRNALYTTIATDLLSEFKDRFGDPNAKTLKATIAKIAMGKADQVEGLDGLLAANEVRQTVVNDIVQRFQVFKAQMQVAEKKLKADYDLYKIDDVGKLVGANPVDPARKPVYNPVIYMEEEQGSLIKNDFVKRYACVLLANVYERGVGAASANDARDRVKGLLANIKQDTDLGADLGIKSGDFRLDLTMKKDELYAAVKKMHDYFKGEKGIAYDLDKNIESVMDQSGYEMLVSCNCNWVDLPSNLPPGFTLNAGTYVFGIVGHNTTVKVKQNISENTVIDNRANYFESYNEAAENFDGDPYGRKIRNIWKKK